MARKSVKKHLGEKEVVIRELRVKDIIELFQLADQNKENPVDMLKDHIAGYLPRVTENLSLDDLLEAAPSEIDELIAGFQEVNQSFFTLTKRLGLDKLMDQVKLAISNDFSGLFAESFQAAMAAGPGTMAIPSSNLP